MLVLRSNEGTRYNLTTKSEHTVGRHGSDIVISNDDSISRKHASFRILVARCKLHIEVCDTGSKHGTFVNAGIEKSNAIPKNCKISLKIKDRIRFGLRLSIWTLEEEPFLICVTSLTIQQETMLSKLFTKVRGSKAAEWSKTCTHLTVNEIRIETKVVCALAYLKPIVSFNYWEQLLIALTSRVEQPLPNCSEFIPVADSALRRLGRLNFSMNPLRRVLFRNHQFVAFDREQCETLSPIIEAAGGKITDGTTTKLSLKQLMSKNVIILQAKHDRNKKVMETCLDLLKKQKKRAIPETEICLSIIHASKDQFCNPSYDVRTLFKHETPVMMNDDTVLVDDSQDISEAFTEIQGLGSGSNFSLAINDQNRALSDIDDNFVVQDSPPIIEESSATRSGVKRKLEEPLDKPSVKNSKLDSDHKMVCLEGISSKMMTSSKENSSCFQTSIKTSGRSSRSLFAGVKDRVMPNSKILLEKSSIKSSSSLIPDSLKGPEDDTLEELSRCSPRSLFAKSNIKSPELASASLFFSNEESSPMLGKRKAPEEESCPSLSKRKLSNLEPKPLTSKQANGGFTLFQSKQLTRKSRAIAVDSGDEMDSPTNLDPSTLKISRTPTKRSLPLPVVQVPKTVDLSNFMEAHCPENMIKRELELDISSEIKDMLDKTVLHSVPLVRVKTKEDTIVSEQINDFRPNFKKFRKNPSLKPSNIIPVTSLILFKSNIKYEM